MLKCSFLSTEVSYFSGLTITITSTNESKTIIPCNLLYISSKSFFFLLLYIPLDKNDYSFKVKLEALPILINQSRSRFLFKINIARCEDDARIFKIDMTYFLNIVRYNEHAYLHIKNLEQCI